MQVKSGCRFVASIVLATGLVAHVLAGQTRPLAPAPCFHLEYTRDTAVTWFPDGFQWQASDPVAHIWWENPTPDARELQRQTHGNAKWRRMSTDSVSLVVWDTFVSSMDIHFVPRADSIRGRLNWYGEAGGPRVSLPFVAVKAACPTPMRAPANER